MSPTEEYRGNELRRIRREAVDLTAGGQSFEAVVNHIQKELRCVDDTLAALGTAMKLVDRAINEAIRRNARRKM
jgi:hypothetical protein